MLRKIDLVLRFIYVALVPVILAVMAQLMPVMGLVVSAAIATVIALTGSGAWRDRVGTIPVVGKFLGNMARLGEYYAEHPPKLLVYYLVYPLLFPYWLFVKKARTEFLLYRRISLLVLVFALVGGTVSFFTKWYPDIPFSKFMGAVLGLLILQLLLTFTVIMPIVTTVILYHQRRWNAALITVLGLGLLTGIPMYLFMHSRPSFLTVSFEARTRIKERTKLHPDEAKAAMHAAVDAGNRTAIASGFDRDATMAAVWDALEAFYKPDESHAFLMFNDSKNTQLLLMARPDRNKPAIAWYARDATGRQILDVEKLVPELRAAVGK